MYVGLFKLFLDFDYFLPPLLHHAPCGCVVRVERGMVIVNCSCRCLRSGGGSFGQEAEREGYDLNGESEDGRQPGSASARASGPPTTLTRGDDGRDDDGDDGDCA